MIKSRFDITAGGPGDVAEILPLMMQFNAGENIPWRHEPMRGALERVIGDRSVGVVLVARESTIGTLIGYGVATFGFDIEFAGRDAFITELFVAAPQRGHGVGRALLDRFVDVLREAGAGAVHLVVRPDNPRAQRLYEAYGFQAVPRILMTRTLVP